jgi:hypothetical protein
VRYKGVLSHATSMKQLFKLLLVLSIGFAATNGVPVYAKQAAKVSNKKGAPLTPAKLLHDMQVAAVYIVNKAEADKVNPKSKQSRPFWHGMVSVLEGLEALEAGMQKKDSGILTGLEDIGRGLSQTSASWAMLRGAYPQSTVGRGISALHTAYETYVEHFGPAVARYKKKAPLTAKEKQNLARSGQQLDALFGNMKKVYAKAKPKSYQQRMLQDLVDYINRLDTLRGKGKGKLGYAAYMYQWNRLQQTIWAYSEIIFSLYPEFYEQAWQLLEADIEQMDVCFGSEEEIYASFYEETSWDITSEVIEEYDDYYEETAVVAEVEEELDEAEQDEELADLEELEDDLEQEDVENLACDEALEEEIDEELDEEEVDGDNSLADEVGESYGDDDGDGVADEEDADDDNDGVADAEDTDDDCDGVCDTGDADTEEEEAEEEAEEDDNGIAECIEGDYDCGGGCDGGCSDGGCSCDGCCEE